MPKVLFLFPPNYGAINAAFKVRGQPVIFAYGDAIYNPSKMKIPPELLVHEAVHLRRQDGDPATWWARYIKEPRFRLEEEIPAHAAEYRDLCARGLERITHIAERLASPLYGGLVDFDTAKHLILNG